jgi:hypothetical protein
VRVRLRTVFWPGVLVVLARRLLVCGSLMSHVAVEAGYDVAWLQGEEKWKECPVAKLSEK